jgi:hypothetical protein
MYKIFVIAYYLMGLMLWSTQPSTWLYHPEQGLDRAAVSLSLSYLVLLGTLFSLKWLYSRVETDILELVAAPLVIYGYASVPVAHDMSVALLALAFSITTIKICGAYFGRGLFPERQFI